MRPSSALQNKVEEEGLLAEAGATQGHEAQDEVRSTHTGYVTEKGNVPKYDHTR